MTLFIESEVCRSRLKCHLCRADNRLGDQFRRTFAKHFEMPGEGLFDCPFEVEVSPVVLTVSAGVPRERWPRRVRLLARFAKPRERGVGDTLARLLGKVGGEVWKGWYQRLTGKDCGCGDRQGRLNERYPYG